MQTILRTILLALVFAPGLQVSAWSFDLRAGPQATNEVKGRFDACLTQFANSVPPSSAGDYPKQLRALCFDGFAVLHSGETKTPVYSAEVLSRQRVMMAKGSKRTDVFFPDARLPRAERANLDDYAGSGFDRGHMTPAGDMNNPEGMAQSFSLANIVPQAPENNRGAWAKIEQSTRKYVERAQGNVYVITGVAHIPGQCPIEASGCLIGAGVQVPSHIYKLVYDAVTNRAWAHWIENKNEARIARPITYQELVRRIGIELLPGIAPNA